MAKLATLAKRHWHFPLQACTVSGRPDACQGDRTASMRLGRYSHETNPEGPAEMSAWQNLEATAGAFIEGIAFGGRYRFPNKHRTAKSWSARGTLNQPISSQMHCINKVVSPLVPGGIAFGAARDLASPIER